MTGTRREGAADAATEFSVWCDLDEKIIRNFTSKQRVMNTEMFITELLARPVIWKSRHPQHKYKNIVRRMWDEIQTKFPDCSVSFLKNKWKNLRDTYSKHLKKIPTLRSGASPSDYEPSWKYFAILGFLKDEYMPLSAESNLDERDSDNIISDNENDDFSADDLSVQSPPSPTSSELNVPPSSRSSTKAKFSGNKNSSSTSRKQCSSKSKPSSNLSYPHEPTNSKKQCSTKNRQYPNLSLSNEPTNSKKQNSTKRIPSPTLINEPTTSGLQKRKIPKTMTAIRTEYLEIEKKILEILEKECGKHKDKQDNQSSEKKSDDYYFLMSILSEMEKLPAVQKLRLRNKINDALLDEINIKLFGEFHE